MLILECRICGLKSTAVIPENLDDHYDESYFLKPGQVGYQAEGYSNYDGIPDSEFAWRLNLLSLFCPNRGRLLDVGCATGKFMRLALREGWDAEGIDVSPFAVQTAREKGLTAHLGTVESVPLLPESFDVITAFDVLEHVQDVRGFLDTVHTILKPGGRLIVLSPNAGAFRAIAMAERWIGYRTSLEHIHYFDMRFLRNALAEIFQDRHLTVAEFERGEYDYLLGVAEKRPSPSSTLPQGPSMKVLFVNRSDSFWRPGGDVVQMLETKRNLEDLGAEIDISLSGHPIGVGYDLAHVFNSQIPYEEFEQVRHLKQVRLPVCLSTIYWDATETLWADMAVRAIFRSAKDEAQLESYIDRLHDQTLEIKGLSPVSPSPYYRAVKAAQRRLFEQVDYLLPNSQLEMREISIRHGICNKPFTVVPNGVDPEIFLCGDADRFIDKYGVRDFVVMAGRIEGRKNQLLTLYALRNENLPVVIIGGQYDRDYAQLCRKWAGPNVLFLGHLPQTELASAYAAARVCILPSWMETPGLAALEAALAGCNLVVTNRGATWEYFGNYAYYCDPSDPESIRDATLKAYNNFERDRPRREAFRDLILSQYNWKQAAEKTLIGYKNLLASHAHSAAIAEDWSAEGRRYQVSIIIPVFNKIEYTVRCLQALEANTPKELQYEVIIVDNASTDATPDILAGLEGDVTVVRNEKNLGFARACNQGAKIARGDYLVFLNNDTEPQPGWLEALLTRAQDERVGIVGAKLLFPDGRIQHAGFAGANDPASRAGVSLYHIYYHMPGELEASNRTRDLQAVTGACMLIMKPLFDMIGGFNEIYYNGCEDIDLCFRVRSLGYRVVYEPKSVLVHYESVSGPERFRKTSDNVILFNSYWSGRIKPDDQDIYLSDGLFARFVKDGEQCRRELMAFPSVSLVLMLGDEWDTTRKCLDSLTKWTPVPIELILTGHEISRELYNKISSIAHRQGFTVKITQTHKTPLPEGIPESSIARRAADLTGEYVVFMDDGCMVSEGWLEGLLKCVESHPLVGAVGPVFNGLASMQYRQYAASLAGDSKTTVREFADMVRANNEGKYVEVRSLEPFFFLTKAWVLRELDLGEQIPGSADNGLLLRQSLSRIAERGYHLRVAMDVYVHRQARPNHEAVDEAIATYEDASESRREERKLHHFPSHSDGGGSDLIGVYWEGSQFIYHSLALINREMAIRLAQDPSIELSVIPYEPDQFDVEVNPRFQVIEERRNRPLSTKTRIHVQHRWPPKLEPPGDGHWVVIQPWEFGAAPEAWVEAWRDKLDELWVPSEFVKGCYARSGIPKQIIHVIYNGVDTERYNPRAEPLPLTKWADNQGISLEQSTYKFLFVGGTIFRKGIDILLDAYCRAFTRKDDVCLIIKDMGGDSFYQGQTAKSRIQDLQRDPNAPSILYVDNYLTEEEMARLYTAADCLVHPFRGEGFGLPIAEAMSSGLPVIVSKYGPALEICDEDRAYFIPGTIGYLPEERLGRFKTVGRPWLFEPDSGILAKLLQYAATHPEEASQKGRNGRIFVEEYLTWERMYAGVRKRLGELREKPIRRFDVKSAAGENQDIQDIEPIPLVESRGTHLLMIPDWEDPTDLWRSAIRSFVNEFSPDEDVGLVIRIDPDKYPDQEQVVMRIAEWAQAEGVNLQAGHMIVVLNDPVPASRKGAIYRTSHIFINTASGDTLGVFATEARSYGLIVCGVGGRDMRDAVSERLGGDGRLDRQ